MVAKMIKRSTPLQGALSLTLALGLTTFYAAAAAPGSPSAKGASGAQIEQQEKTVRTIDKAAEKTDRAAEKTDKAKEKPAGEKKEPAKADSDKKDSSTKAAADKKEAKPVPEIVIENVVNVPAETLADHASEYLNKNVRFVSNFHSYSNIALDYKPALRPAKTYLSFLVLRNNSKVPLSELKLAMPIPKEDDKSPQAKLLGELKDGDQLEITGKVFAIPLDEPWVDVLKIKRLKAAADDKDKKVAAEAAPAK